MRPIGWTWSRTREYDKDAHCFATKKDAMRNAVGTELLYGGRSSASVDALCDTEVALVWRSLAREGWTLFEVKAELA